uniref:MADF domain-containing protein n=1 Tax=Anabas testudineus TaxID=64144 RepID=A0A3Q1JIN1_ANATE
MNSVERKLADLIRQHPHLYDHTQRDYKDPAKGHLSWKEIADAMGKSEDEVKLKWKNLRDKFCKAKKRMAKRNRPVPVLFGQLAWLSAYVKPRVESGPGDPEEVSVSVPGISMKECVGEQHCSLPVVSTSFSLAESCSTSDQEMKRTSAALKRKRQTASETEISSADALNNLRDEDEMFLLSLLPSLKRLNIKKRMEVRMKFQQVLYAAEFED